MKLQRTRFDRRAMQDTLASSVGMLYLLVSQTPSATTLAPSWPVAVPPGVVGVRAVLDVQRVVAEAAGLPERPRSMLPLSPMVM
jgi:hypothetical protein